MLKQNATFILRQESSCSEERLFMKNYLQLPASSDLILIVVGKKTVGFC